MLNLNTQPQSLTKGFKLFLVISIIFALSSPSIAGTAKPRIVTDQLGRKVTLPADPKRVVALAPSITEIIFDLKQEKRLVGVTQFSDFPPKAQLLPKVGSYVHLDIERIVSLDPDLCIGIKDGNPRHVVYKLDRLGIPVYVVDPRDLNSVMNTVLEIGSLLNANKEAAEVAKNMHNRIENIKKIVRRAKTKPRVFFQIGISPIVSVGTNTFINELIALAGGSEKIFESVKKQWEKWPEIPACRNHKIFLVDSNLFDRPTPRLVQGLEILLKLLHPELVGDKR